MTPADLLTDAEVEPLEVEPLEVEPLSPPSEVSHDDVARAEVEPAMASTGSTSLIPLMEVLPVDFALPALIRFVPDGRLRAKADQAAAYALGVTVTGAEGLKLADVSLTTLRADLKEIEQHFEEPTATANALHKRLTGMRSEWITRGEDAVKIVGRRMWAEQQRLDAIEAEARREAQRIADAQAREAARLEAEAAKAAAAPVEVVQELEQQARTITAPPVAPTAQAAPKLVGSTAVTTWKARFSGSPAEADPNPDIEVVTPAQRLKVFELLRAILEGKAPIAAIQVDWAYLNKRAKADKGTLAIPGIEAFQEGGIRAKGARSRA